MNVKDFILEESSRESRHIHPESDPYWKSLRETGTEIWLDTGDIDAAASLWSSEMSALTTNNTLLNKEIQKGLYDKLIGKADKLLEECESVEKIQEIAFILNAVHGRRLVDIFGGKVSVELHTDFAHDYEMTIHYAERFHEIEPDNFIIKVPYTAEGLMATRELERRGIPVNMTLGFSARQNYLAAQFAHPHYVNVFLGRINSYFSDNSLSSGNPVGEKTTISSQRYVHRSNDELDGNTKQIAASMRDSEQLSLLSGVDVFTIPIKVAKAGKKNGGPEFRSRLSEEYTAPLAPGVNPNTTRVDKLFEVSEAENNFIQSIRKSPPASSNELIEQCRSSGCEDLLPPVQEEELQQIAEEGKIPVHSRWEEKISKGKTSIDTLLNLAGIETFRKDQDNLDARIESLTI